jgi:transposase InsO family protein
MPWKNRSKEEQRLDLVRQMAVGAHTVGELCRRFGVTRQTAYKWRRRYRQKRLRGLRDQSRRPLSLAAQTSVGWLRRVRQLRRRRPTWGARKLRHVLAERFGKKGAPALATISRWLKRWGLSRGRRRRLRGPVIWRKTVHNARRCHDVWTVDFKGWHRTGDGTRVEPLTVRDLYSRYALAVVLLRRQGIVATQRVFLDLFGRHGLPRRIRCDNGTPFGGGSASGLSRLSAWWVKLGIEVEFITPGRPCENGAHEQFHRVYEAEVVVEPAMTVRGQQRRTDRWLVHYNEERPHEALGMKRPAQVFRPNRRRLPAKVASFKYPAGWARCWVKGNGEISWRGQWRFVGEAFVREYVGLKPAGQGIWQVYFGRMLVGELHENESGRIRMARYVRGG